MSVSLQKGQKVSLSKDNAGLSKVIVGLGWDEVKRKTGFFAPRPQPIDCDASALALVNGKLIRKEDVVFFGNLRHPTGTIEHMGDNLTGAGEGDDEQIVVDLARIPAEYDKVVLVVNIYQAEKTALWADRECLYPPGEWGHSDGNVQVQPYRQLHRNDIHDIRRDLPPERGVEVQRHRPGHH